jgi:hypothetical protein
MNWICSSLTYRLRAESWNQNSEWVLILGWCRRQLLLLVCSTLALVNSLSPWTWSKQCSEIGLKWTLYCSHLTHHNSHTLFRTRRGLRRPVGRPWRSGCSGCQCECIYVHTFIYSYVHNALLYIHCVYCVCIRVKSAFVRTEKSTVQLSDALCNGAPASCMCTQNECHRSMLRGWYRTPLAFRRLVGGTDVVGRTT